MDPIQALEEKYGLPLSEPLKELLRQFQPTFYKKGTHLLVAGEIAAHSYYIAKGLARLYRIIDGKEFTTRFAYDGMIIWSYNSFYNQIPSEEFLEVLEESEVMSITRDQYVFLCDNNFEFNKIMMRWTWNVNIENEKRELIILSTPHGGRERYLRMRQLYPEVFKRVSDTKLASFLGMSRKQLSRIKVLIK